MYSTIIFSMFCSKPCFPIYIPPGDRHFDRTCMNFARSQPEPRKLMCEGGTCIVLNAASVMDLVSQWTLVYDRPLFYLVPVISEPFSHKTISTRFLMHHVAHPRLSSVTPFCYEPIRRHSLVLIPIRIYRYTH